jgi:hypothetical protein
MEQYVANCRRYFLEKHNDWLHHKLTRSRSYVKSTGRGNVATLNSHQHLSCRSQNAYQHLKLKWQNVARQYMTMVI